MLKKVAVAKDAKLLDLSGNVEGITVKFANETVVSIAHTATGPSQIEWRADMTITGTIPPGKTLAREAQLALSGEIRHFTYELTSKVAAMTWTLNQPVPAVAVANAAVPLSFSVTATGEGDSTTARLTRSTIRDASNRVVSSDALTLADAAVTLGTPSKLQLSVDGKKIPAGNYTGSVELALLGAPDAKTFDLAISSSPPSSRIIGFFCVFFGVMIAMLIAGVLRNYAAYLSARLPASRITELLIKEQRQLDGVADQTVSPATHKWIDDVLDKLAIGTLQSQGFVPRLLPAAFGSGNVDTAAYTAYLQTQSEAIEKIAYLIERGFLRVTHATTDAAAAAEAYRKLDEVAFDKPADVKMATDAIIAALGTAKGLIHGGSGATLTHHILLRSDFVNGTAWLLFAAIATATGYLAAVNVPGFGLMSDYFRAFLWGLGLQAAGTQLQQLSPSSVASTIGVTLPR